MALLRRVFQFTPPAIPRARLSFVWLAVVLVGVAAALVLLISALRVAPPVQAAAPRLVLSSHPFPLSVGNNTLTVQLVGVDGTPVQAGAVRFDTSSPHPGSLPLSRPATAGGEGIYSAMLTYSMAGAWAIDVTADLPDGETLTEHFDVFVYPVPPANRSTRATFVSASELAAIPYDAAKELRITIPQGTQAGIVGGHGDDVIGDEIRLSVSGRNTLIIQNNDIANHKVGPFFVRAGETVRQEFRSPAEYQGACSIRHGAEVNIIVEA